MTAGAPHSGPTQTTSPGALAALTLLLLATVAGWYWIADLSSQFIWGERHSERPILTVMAALGFQWLIWAIIVWIISTQNTKTQSCAAFACCVAGLVSQFFFLNTNPILEHDGYRYLHDGGTLSEGVSPYCYSPAEIESKSAHSAPALQTLSERFRSDPAAQRNLERVGYPDIKTIYPPAAQFVFWSAYKIGGFSWTGLRLIFVPAYAVGILLTFAALRTQPGAQVRLALLSLCPLTIKEIGSSAHVDAMLVLYFGALLYQLSRHERIAPHVLALSSGVVMALAIATKFFPIIALPLVAAWFYSRISVRAAIIMLVSTFAFTAATYLPFLAMGERNFFSALGPFNNTWLRNPSVFGILNWSATAVFGDTPVSCSFIPGGTGPLGTVVAKLIAHVLLIAAIVVCTLRVLRNARISDPVELVSQNASLLFIAWFLLLPMAFPWYLLSALPFLACARFGLVPWFLIASVSVFYYGDFYLDANDLSERWTATLLRVEYGLPLVAALIIWTRRNIYRWLALVSGGAAR
ncbi:MAG: hypothetical protein WCT04_10480 [Planctomycetota bacterium]